MKPITYWEEKRQQTVRFLETLTRMGLQERFIPAAPERRDYGAKWVSARIRWEKHQRLILAHRRRVLKAQARLAYFEERIRLLTPTFWERL